jgi:hypothetical protein
MKSLNNLKQTLSVLKTGQSLMIKGGTNNNNNNNNNNNSIGDTGTTTHTSDSVGGPWDNRGKRPGTKG